VKNWCYVLIILCLVIFFTVLGVLERINAIEQCKDKVINVEE
jgi:hypothetical protein